MLFSQNDVDNLPVIESELAKKILSQKINLNTLNYDLKYHKLDLDLNPEDAFISGVITSHFLALEDLEQITFDLSDNLQVESVIYLATNANLGFTQNSNDEVIIDLPNIQNQGVLDSISISYSGNPVSSGFGSFEHTPPSGYLSLCTTNISETNS